ncbi:MAG: hypothetical protein JNJ94_06310, partial [Chlorobi bacterium]|nr:hypothetical protein [Chlorobiota bacterium]
MADETTRIPITFEDNSPALVQSLQRAFKAIEVGSVQASRATMLAHQNIVASMQKQQQFAMREQLKHAVGAVKGEAQARKQSYDEAIRDTKKFYADKNRLEQESAAKSARLRDSKGHFVKSGGAIGGRAS